MASTSKHATQFKRRALFVYGSGGSGHLASATAVRDAIQRRTPLYSNQGQLEIIMADGSKMAGAEFADQVYNAVVMSGLPLTSALYSVAKLTRPISRVMLCRSMKVAFDELEKQHGGVDFIVSFVPFLNEALLFAAPHLKLLTVLTDISDSDAHPWLQDTRQYVFCPTENTVRQAKSKGWRDDRIIFMSGLVINESFYASSGYPNHHLLSAIRRDENQYHDHGQKLNPLIPRIDVEFDDPGSFEWKEICSFDNHEHHSDRAGRQLTGRRKDRLKSSGPRRLTACFFFGGIPPTAAVIDFLEYLVKQDAAVNIIVVCAKNTALRRKMILSPEIASCMNSSRVPKTSRHRRTRIVSLGFVRNVAAVLKKCDIVVGKPGPGTVTEAHVMRKPIVIPVFMIGAIMEQEQEMLDIIEDTQTGIVVKSREHLVEILQNPPLASQIGFNLNRLPLNEAIFRVVDYILDLDPENAFIDLPIQYSTC